MPRYNPHFDVINRVVSFTFGYIR